MPIIKNDSTPNSKTVTGIDLGPSLKNDSTGIMIGKKVEKNIGLFQICVATALMMTKTY